MANTYYPPRNLSVPWKTMVLRADPDFEASKRKELFYRFSNGRTFIENPANQGAYSSAPHDNPPFT